MKASLHTNNKHKNGYDFVLLQAQYPDLKPFVIEKYNKLTIDFSDPKAVKMFNKALFYTHYGIDYWDFPDDNLCPPIPGRVDYIHHIADLVSTEPQVNVMDIGTGASCVYPLLGAKAYDWNFVATDIDLNALDYSQDIIDDNNLENKIELRQQLNEAHILEGVIEEGDKFTLTMCNPPFYKSAEEARGANRRKTRNLGNNAVRNFSGNNNELWYVGGEKAFLHTYMYESSKFPKVSQWFTSLVSKKENVDSLEASAKKLKVSEFKVIPMHQGNKVTRIVCWRF